MRLSIYIKEETYRYIKTWVDRFGVGMFRKRQQEVMLSISAGTPMIENKTHLTLEQFENLLDNHLPRQTYIVSIKYKYEWETEYETDNIIYEYNGNEDIYEITDWNEGQTDCYVTGYVALSDVKIE